MRRIAVIAAVVLTAFASSAQASSSRADWQIHKGATALTWLSNPAHARFGTPRTRARATDRSYGLLMRGLRSIGFLDAAMCVHRGEGSWQDPDGLYYGGMQADLSFQSSYGYVYLKRWGTADHWPVWAQLHMAYRGWKARGWYPWPKTARACGLI